MPKNINPSKLIKMNPQTIRSCIKYFEKVTMNEIKQAHACPEYDEIELTDYAKDLVDKNSKRKPLGLTNYAKHLLNKGRNNNI
jgi:hypothetical protein